MLFTPATRPRPPPAIRRHCGRRSQPSHSWRARAAVKTRRKPTFRNWVCVLTTLGKASQKIYSPMPKRGASPPLPPQFNISQGLLTAGHVLRSPAAHTHTPIGMCIPHRQFVHSVCTVAVTVQITPTRRRSLFRQSRSDLRQIRRRPTVGCIMKTLTVLHAMPRPAASRQTRATPQLQTTALPSPRHAQLRRQCLQRTRGQ